MANVHSVGGFERPLCRPQIGAEPDGTWIIIEYLVYAKETEPLQNFQVEHGIKSSFLVLVTLLTSRF